MRAFPICIASGLWLILSGCQLPLFDNGFGDVAKRGDRGRSVDAPARSVAERQRRDADSRTGQPVRRSNLDPGRLASLNQFLQRGNASLQNNALADARIQFDAALQIDPQNNHALHMLGRIGDQEGRFEDAEYHYLRALATGRNANLLSDLGYSYMQRGKLGRAREHLLQALAEQPDHRMAKINLGAVYAWSGDQKGALAWLRQVGTEEQAVASLSDIMRNRPAGSGAGTQIAEQPPQQQETVEPADYQAMIAQMEATRRQTQLQRQRREQADELRIRQRIESLMNEDDGALRTQFETRPQTNEPLIRHAVPPRRQPLDGYGPQQGGETSQYQNPQYQNPQDQAQPYYMNPPPGQQQPEQRPGDSTMPEQWPHGNRVPNEAYLGGGDPRAVPYTTQPPFNGHVAPRAMDAPAVPQQYRSPQAGWPMNPAGAPWPAGRPNQSDAGPNAMPYPAQNYQGPGGRPQNQPIQNQPVQTIEQTAHWAEAEQRNQAAQAASRAARMGMSAGPGGLFPMGTQPRPDALAPGAPPQNGFPQNQYQPNAPPQNMPPQNGQHQAPGAGPAGQHDVWRPGQPDSDQYQSQQPVVPGGQAPGAPSVINWNQVPPSQIQRVPSPTWNMQNQQAPGRQGQWTQPEPLGQQWQNGSLASPTRNMQSATSGSQFAQPYYYTPPPRTDGQQRETLDLNQR